MIPDRHKPLFGARAQFGIIWDKVCDKMHKRFSIIMLYSLTASEITRIPMFEQPSPTDIELMQRIERQDQVALALLYARYGKPMYSLTFRILQNTVMAEEATQDAFLKVWRLADRWDSNKGQLLSWLLTVARHSAIDRLRQEKRQSIPNQTSLEDTMPIVSHTDVPDDPMLRDGQLLRQLMHQLPPEQAQAIEMAFFGGLTHSELAARLNLPLGTVKARIRMGIQKLRNYWQEATEPYEKR
jgi:RNA polymerase sigma-70 factor (ECF subfamily)